MKYTELPDIKIKWPDMRRFISRVRKKSRMAAAAGLVAGFAAGVLITVVSANGIISQERTEFLAEKEALNKEKEELEEQLSKNRAVWDNEEVLAEDVQEWYLVLVNEDHPLDASYVPDALTDISEQCQVDSRIAEDLQQMMADGAAEGLSMYVTSAYRSYERQAETFNASMQNRLNQGMTPLDAYRETSIQVALPGTSEHATGLAVDIISTQYGELDERQGDTAEQKWLMEHCWEYGFILRYPSQKSDITGIIYEPWHYRYVGKEAAEEITEKGLTLEEYLLS